MAELLLFLGDIKGTKDELGSLDQGGRATLERRIQSLYDSFAEAFSAHHDRSRSMVGVAFSDSVLAYWADMREGQRFAPGFMRAVWHGLDRPFVRFRGFLDAGEFIQDASALTHGLALAEDRFLRVLPVGIAAWSVAVAEASHFPDGLFVSESLVGQLAGLEFSEEVHMAESFQYRRMLVEDEA